MRATVKDRNRRARQEEASRRNNSNNEQARTVDLVIVLVGVQGVADDRLAGEQPLGAGAGEVVEALVACIICLWEDGQAWREKINQERIGKPANCSKGSSKERAQRPTRAP